MIIKRNNTPIFLISIIVVFLILSGCGMSEEKQTKMNESTLDKLETTEFGEEVDFGFYKGHPIKWIVVEEKDGAYLLVAKNTKEKKKYNDEGGSTKTSDPLFHANEWSNCSLRAWLNNDFYKEAFEKAAQDAIVTCDLKNSFIERYNKSGGKDTADEVFILSFAEIKNYLEPLNAVSAKGKTYWLRNPSGTNGCFAGICEDSLSSQIMYMKSDDIESEYGVRPAVWVAKNPIDSIVFHIGAYDEDTNDYTSSPESKPSNSSKRTCPNCSGTGFVKYYATDNPWEQGEIGECPMCHGTGTVQD